MDLNPQEPPGVDPDNVPETLCLGKFNVSFMGPLATITFTHIRPQTGPLIDRGETVYESVVRARIVTTGENMVAMRDLLTQLITDAASPSVTTTGGSRKPN